jgi:ABC-type glycerol-3-phosphate transport system substrate-binding protein
MEWLFATFQARNPAVKLDVFGIPSYEDAQSKIKTECASGSCPDVLHAVT